MSDLLNLGVFVMWVFDNFMNTFDFVGLDIGFLVL